MREQMPRMWPDCDEILSFWDVIQTQVSNLTRVMNENDCVEILSSVLCYLVEIKANKKWLSIAFEKI